MPNNRKTRPLAHFPSAMAQDSTPVDMPRRAGFFKRFFRFAFLVLLFAGLSTAGVYYYLSRGPISNERLRIEIVSVLSSMMGPDFSAKISTARISLGKTGLLSIGADGVEIANKAGDAPFGSASQVHAGIKLLPLLKGEYKVQTVLVEDAVLDVRRVGLADRGWSGEWPDAFHLENLMRIPANRLFHLSKSMGVAGLEKVTWRNLRVKGVRLSGAKTKDIVIHKVVATIDHKTGNLDIQAEATIDSKDVHLVGAWEKSADNFALRLEVDGLDASDILQSAAGSSEGFLGLDAPVKLAYYHPYKSNMRSMQSTIRIDIASGLIRFGKDDLAPFSGGQLNFRLLPEKNQIELEKSPVKFQSSSAVLTGGIRFPLRGAQNNNHDSPTAITDAKNALNLQKPIFEIIANDIIADPSEANGIPVEASLKVGGTLDAKAKVIEMTNINLWTSDGFMHGAGSFGFAGETPSLALALTIPKISVAAVKQVWPFFIASKARRWVMTHINGGQISDASIDAAIPAGILGNIKKGKKLTPEQFSLSLNIADTNVETTGELPTISQASGTLLYHGMKTRINLTSGGIHMESGRQVQVKDGLMNIGDFQDKPTMADLSLEMKGNASDLLWIGSRKPLRVGEELKITPSEIEGEAKINLNLRFPLEKSNSDQLVEWRARVKLSDVSLSKPLDGRKISRANVSIDASPGLATIEGNVHIDGIRSVISLSEPFGDNPGSASKREIKLVLNAKARKKLGVDLSGLLKGQVTARIKSLKSKNTSKVVVNLTNATLVLPWVNWTKGKGIKASAEFVMQTKGKRTSIRNLILRGAGFKIAGKLEVDKRGLIKANLSQFSLNKSDDLKLKLVRTASGYSIKASGKSYDARAIIKQIINKGTPKSRLTSKIKIALKGEIAEVVGFGGESLSDVNIEYIQRDGALARALLTGTAARGLKTALSISPDNGTTTTTLVSSNAGAALRFLDIYARMSFGALSATFKQKGDGPHSGKLIIENFWLKNEPRLKRLLSTAPVAAEKGVRAQLDGTPKRVIDPNDVKVTILNADIVKTDTSLKIKNGILRSADVGSNFSGTVYDDTGKMDLRGTYLPGYGLNKIASKIPIVGLAFGDGIKRGFLGITYRLRGKAKNPKITVNPISVITPGIFRKVFEVR